MTFATPLPQKWLVCIATTMLLLMSGLASFPVHAASVLHLWAWRDSDVALWRYISEHELIPQVSVIATAIAPESYEQIRLGDFQTLSPDRVPDMIQVQAGAQWLTPLIAQGALTPLHQVDLTQQYPAALSTVSGADGIVYGIPFGMQMSAVLYNKDLFAELDLTIPTTDTEWTTLLKRLARAGVIPLYVAGGAGWWTSQVLHETLVSGRVPADVARGLVDGTACFTDPSFVDALASLATWRRYMNDSPAVDSYQDMQTALALGDAAMMIDGMWSTEPTSSLFQMTPNLTLGFFPLPGSGGQLSTFASGGYVGLSESVNGDAVRAVMQFMATETFAQLSFDMTGEIPAFTGKLQVEDARINKLAGQIRANAYSASTIFAPQLNLGNTDFGGLLSTAYQQLLAGKMTAEDLAKNVQTGLNSSGYAGAKFCEL